VYLLARAKRPAWLQVDRLLGEWGMPEDSPAGRQRLERALEERRGMEEGEEFKPIWRGWCLGEEKFREELLTQMSERMGVEHYGPLAGGDDEDGGVDRRTSGDGHARLSEPSLYIAGESWAESNQYQELTPLRGVTNIQN